MSLGQPTIDALPIAIPFVAAAVLVALHPLSRRVVNETGSLLAVAAVIALAAILLADSTSAPFAYWLGGWRPAHGVTIGISLSIDPLGAGLAVFSAFLVACSLTYSLRYFDTAGGLFLALMLVFGAAMVGFCLTGDLFNLVVFFELMGVAAYALTAQHVEEKAPIQGALNFAITNSVAGYAMFIGVALLYARTGALNMAQIGATLDGHRADALVIVAMALLFAGFLTKAAAVPLHFWLADAHAVAPTPVCVLFSGVMIELGVYAVARLYWEIFAGPLLPHVHALRAVLIAVGVLTALAASAMCVVQRHIKRLLAFSSIAHVGMFVCGVGLFTGRALAGVAVYIVGHGLTKGALFLCTGVLLHRFASVDEYELHGRGRGLRTLGVLFAAGGVLLAAAPPFTLFAGKSLLEDAAAAHGGYGFLIGIFIAVSALTGGAVLRVAGRVFLGWGPSEAPDPGQGALAHEPVDEQEGARREHVPRVMLAVPALMLALVLAVSLVPGAVPGFQRAAALFTDHGAYARWVLHGARVHLPVAAPSPPSGADVLSGGLSLLGALAAAGAGLFGRPLRGTLPARVATPATAVVQRFRDLHSGHIGDYITWWAAGASVLGGVCLIVL